MAQRYKIKLHKKVLSEDSRHFDRKVKDRVKRKCQELLSVNPNSVGEALRFELKNYRKLKIFNDYRIIYRVDDEQVLVFVLAVGIRRDSEVYSQALKRLQGE